jgi:hypothetical protein
VLEVGGVERHRVPGRQPSASASAVKYCATSATASSSISTVCPSARKLAIIRWIGGLLVPSAAPPLAHCTAATPSSAGLEAGRLGEPDRAVVVQLERLVADLGQDRRDQRPRAARGEQAAGVLDVERLDVRARRHRPRGFGVVRVVVDRADRVDQRPDHLLAAAAP